MGHQHHGTDLDGELDGVAAPWGWSCCGKAVLAPPACPGLYTRVHTQVHGHVCTCTRMHCCPC